MREILNEAFARRKEGEEYADLGATGSVARERKPDFDVRQHGYAKRLDVALAFSDLYAVKQNPSGKNDCFKRLEKNEGIGGSSSVPKPSQISSLPKASPLPVASTAATKEKNAAVERVRQQLKTLYSTEENKKDKNRFVDLCRVGPSLQKSWKKAGFGSLLKFLNAFPDLYRIKRESNSKNYYKWLK